MIFKQMRSVEPEVRELLPTRTETVSNIIGQINHKNNSKQHRKFEK